MLSREVLLKEIDGLPAEFMDELQDFVQFLKLKRTKKNMEATLLSESSLRKDWLSAEEDEAWRDL
ncbi:MAG: DUF2281 domain-containing protein [Coprothermobacterota bacterium]|nr:DUF2281 domain-containing protein [Coprothermobacterota bacterium]